MPNNQKIPFLTTTVKKFTAWNVIFFLILILLLNVMFIFIAVFILHNTIDKRIEHEIEKVTATLEIKDSVININDFGEINEPDFNTITEASLFLQIYDLDGNVLISSNNLAGFGSIPIYFNVSQNGFYFSDMSVGEDRLRIGYTFLFNQNGEKIAILQLATFENELRVIRKKMILFNLFLLPGLILLVIIASIILAKKSFRPINNIIETAEGISAKSLTSRIEYHFQPGDELGRLRDTLNGLFDRIESYVNQLSQFTDHASHQLMNPLTAMKTELEFILKKDRPTEEYKHSLSQLLTQTDHMIKIVRTLLLLSKQDEEINSNKTIFNLSKLLKLHVPTKINSHIIETNIEDDIYIKGDSDKFLMVVENLVDNAVKYSPEEYTVFLKLKTKNGEIELIVEDNGMGIDAAEKEKIFDRFYRSSTSEKIGIRGYGLGLSLAKTILMEMGATIRIEDNEPTGSKFIITIKALNIV